MDAINQIRKAVDPETFKIASERFVRNIIEAGINPSTGEFAPKRFLTVYDTYKKQIENVLPEFSSNLDVFAETLRRALPDISKAGSSVLGGGLRAAATGGAIAAAAHGNISLVVPEGFAAMMANSMRAPKGVFKRWLTTGFETEKMLRLGGRFVDFNKKPESGPGMNGKPVLLPSH